ncbi:hypothetical protein ABU162_06705 [Paenibacillus thiaminolyticus]|uniref:hypothetical protein n=1 Tax=Paenibacillus thiaminolyticus TaxID=49283 RepID=UPI0035A6B62D
MKLFVGIDVSSEELEACLMKSDGDTLETFKTNNNLHGASYLRDRTRAPSAACFISCATKSVRSIGWLPCKRVCFYSYYGISMNWFSSEK